MAKFILGLVCGIGITLLTPRGRDSVILEPFKKPTAPGRAEAPAEPPQRGWMFDKSRGTLNQTPAPVHF